MTRRELEIAAYSQKLFAEEAEQKAEDLGYALELLLNDRFKLFYAATTSDKGTHEFLMGIARNVPIKDIFRSVRASSQTEDRRIKDVVKLTMGLLVTLSALVLGLLIASAKSSFDAQTADVAAISAKVVLLDRVLANYGPETKEARELLRDVVARNLDRLWPQERLRTSELATPAVGSGAALYQSIQALSPKDNTQRSLQAQAVSMALSLGEIRWLMYAQGANSISKPMLVILVFWLTMIFISFGLMAPTNATVISALLACGLSVSGAVLLILELYSPYGVLIAISSAPLRNALAQLGQ
jgi:hypothetical protein